MKKVIKASTEVKNRKHIVYPSKTLSKSPLSPRNIVELLQEIEELKGLEIFYERTPDGNIEFTIGENVYTNIVSQ